MKRMVQITDAELYKRSKNNYQCTKDFTSLVTYRYSTVRGWGGGMAVVGWLNGTGSMDELIVLVGWLVCVTDHLRRLQKNDTFTQLLVMIRTKFSFNT